MQAKPVYTRTTVMMARLARGGYLHTFTIQRDGEDVGSLAVTRKTRKHEAVATWSRGGQDFTSFAEFKIAVEEAVGKGSDGE